MNQESNKETYSSHTDKTQYLQEAITFDNISSTWLDTINGMTRRIPVIQFNCKFNQQDEAIQWDKLEHFKGTAGEGKSTVTEMINNYYKNKNVQ